MSRANLLMRQQHNRQGRGVFRLVQAAGCIKACSMFSVLREHALNLISLRTLLSMLSMILYHREEIIFSEKGSYN
jgi:hypothetical protein